jgi:hypothetical protein
LAPPLPSLTEPVGVSVSPEPAFLVLNVSLKAAVSPVGKLPPLSTVTIGTTSEEVVPS